MHGEVLESRYRLVEMLGAGGMGQVWRAVDSRLDRDVAVKVITQSPLATSQSAARFRQEARATARLTHPRIVTIHDHGEAAVAGHQVLFLVMELVPGRSMASFTATEQRSVESVVAWGLQICSGLAAAHRAGVVHRDIKPANVMVYGDGEHDLKICDFGIARLVEESGTGLTGTGATIGTPAYMSPEQVRGDRTLDGRSDLYSLGCLLYELLAGRPPFEGAGWSVLAQHLNGTPEPVRSLRPGVPDALDRLVVSLLHKDPDDRPATAEEVAERLRGVLDGPGDEPPGIIPGVRELAAAPTVDAPRAPVAGPPRTPEPEPEPQQAIPQPAAVTEPDPAPARAVAQTIPGAGRVSAWSGLLAMRRRLAPVRPADRLVPGLDPVPVRTGLPGRHGGCLHGGADRRTGRQDARGHGPGPHGDALHRARRRVPAALAAVAVVDSAAVRRVRRPRAVLHRSGTAQGGRGGGPQGTVAHGGRHGHRPAHAAWCW